MTVEVVPRAFRKDLHMQGLIFLNGEERNIIIKNLSISGLLAELDQKKSADQDIKELFQALRDSTFVDLFIPSMRLAGEMEVSRADIHNDKILIALEFRNISYDVEDFIYRRKAYRKTMQGLGRIFLNGAYHPFTALNVSVEGLMIQMDETIQVEQLGMKASFQFEKLRLIGEARIIWVEHPKENETLMGLRYEHLEHGEYNGIARFSNR